MPNYEKPKLISEDQKEISAETKTEILIENFYNQLESHGATFEDNDKQLITEILSNPELYQVDRKKLQQLISVRNLDSNTLAKIQNDKKLGEIVRILTYNLIVTPEFKDMLLDTDLKIDKEFSDIKIDKEKIHKIIKDVLDKKDNIACQGYFWNAIIPTDINYVIKTELSGLSEREIHYRKEVIEDYPFIRDTLGSEFIPKQLVLYSYKEKENIILQEKVDIDNMVCIRSKQLDKLFETKQGKDIIDKLKNVENKKILSRFLDNLYKLTSERYIIDTAGDNLFIGFDNNDKLIIKLIDYGCEKPEVLLGENFEIEQQIINKLRKLI